MSRREDKYGGDEDEEPQAKPAARPGRRLRREDEIGSAAEAGEKESSTDKAHSPVNNHKESGRDSPPFRQSNKSVSSKAEEAAPPKPRRRRADDQAPGADTGGGWMSAPSSNARPVITSTPETRDGVMDEALDPGINANHNKHFDMNKDEGEIIMIPDLEDDGGGGDGDGRVARAPRNLNRKIPTLEELENDARAAIMMGESGLDLSVLLNTLVPPAMVVEDDTPWTFESLLREITDELLPLLKSDELESAGTGQ